jgi:hypothetical protein
MKVQFFRFSPLAAMLIVVILWSSGCYYYDHDYSNPRGGRNQATPTSPAQNWEHHFGD